MHSRSPNSHTLSFVPPQGPLARPPRIGGRGLDTRGCRETHAARGSDLRGATIFEHHHLEPRPPARFCGRIFPDDRLDVVKQMHDPGVRLEPAHLRTGVTQITE